MSTLTPVRPSHLVQRAPSGAGPLHGMGALLRLALRRDRILLPAWLLGFAAMATFSVVATKDLYPSDQDLQAASDLINATASLVALYGKIYAPTSLGAVSLIKMTAFGAALVSVLFVFLTVRHSRAEEESGRLELVAAGSVGRGAPLAAAMALGVGASLVLGGLTAAGLAAAGLPVAGSVAFGISWAMSGIVFTMIAAVAAQISTSGRAALGWGLIGVGVAYALRAVGDLAAGDPGWLSWLSPIGWSQQIRPFAGDRWWVIAIAVIVAVGFATLAFVLRGRRDLGAGFVADRPGPAIGSIDGVPALAWRLQRPVVLAWLAAAAIFGFVLGSVAHNVSGFFDSPQMQQYLVLLGGEQGLTDAFLAAEVAILSVLVAAFGISAVGRMRAEEAAGHTDLLLATATTRVRWAASHVVIALLGGAAILLVAGAAVGAAHAIAIADPGQIGRVTAAAAAHLPAVWVMTAIAVAVYGWAPRALAVVWVLFVAFIVLGEFGELWQVPGWALDLSPFAHSPTLPGPEQSLVPLGWLVAVAAALIGAGLVGWHRRDVQ